MRRDDVAIDIRIPGVSAEEQQRRYEERVRAIEEREELILGKGTVHPVQIVLSGHSMNSHVMVNGHELLWREIRIEQGPSDRYAVATIVCPMAVVQMNGKSVVALAYDEPAMEETKTDEG